MTLYLKHLELSLICLHLVSSAPYGHSTRRKVIHICVFDGEVRIRTLPVNFDGSYGAVRSDRNGILSHDLANSSIDGVRREGGVKDCNATWWTA